MNPTLAAVLQKCHELKVELFVQCGGKLKVKAPAPLPNDLRATLHAHKQEILSLFTQPTTRECLPDSWDNLVPFMLRLFEEHPEHYQAICSAEDKINQLEWRGTTRGEEYERTVDALVITLRAAMAITHPKAKTAMQ